MQRKAEAVLKGRLKEANHLWHLDDVRSEKIGTPNINTKGGPVASGEGLSERGLDPTRAHYLGILHSSPQVVRTARYLISLTLLLPLPTGKEVPLKGHGR